MCACIAACEVIERHVFRSAAKSTLFTYTSVYVPANHLPSPVSFYEQTVSLQSTDFKILGLRM